MSTVEVPKIQTIPKERKKKEEELHRGEWGRKTEFILSLLGYCVGFGNIWRFPFKTYENGGGAFLIPYFIALFMCGLPIFFMELSLGQYSRLSPVKLFAYFSPPFVGIGIAMIIICFLTTIYYNMIMAWTVYYFFASFQKVLPWSRCDAWWNTEHCFNSMSSDSTPQHFNNSACTNSSIDCTSSLNGSLSGEIGQTLKSVSSAEEYFSIRMLQKTDSIEHFGGMQWELILCLLFAWIVVFLCISKGIKTSGKVVYFSALFPYVLMVIICIRAATLPGAKEGVIFYIKPDWQKLKMVDVWKDAFIQIFYSLGPAFGSLMTMASYNKFANNCLRDAIIISITNCLSSVFFGFAIFCVIGFMAHEMNSAIEFVVQDGLGLAFIAYPTVVSRIPLSQLWSCLFFIMLFLIGLDSQFVFTETLLSGALDIYPEKLRKRKTLVVAIICLILFILGLPQCARNGVYIFNLFQENVAGWGLLLIGVIECLVVSYVYGANQFKLDIEFMLQKKINLWWKFNWMLITPIILMIILFVTLTESQGLTYGDYIYPSYVNAIGYLMGTISVIFILFGLVYYLIKFFKEHELSVKNFKEAFKENPKWHKVRKEMNEESLSAKNGVKL